MQEGHPRTSPPARKGGAGLHSALRRLDSLSETLSQGAGPGFPGVASRSAHYNPGSNCAAPALPLPAVELPVLSDQPPGLVPTFCPFALQLPRCPLQPRGSYPPGVFPSPSYTDEDPETLKGNNLLEATQIPVAELRWDPEPLEESKAKSTP